MSAETTPLHRLHDLGVSVWLDDLSRERLRSGNLAALIDSHGVRGVTTNPSIFAAALQDGESYREQLQALASAGSDVGDAVNALMVHDVQEACDVLAGIAQASAGVDGRVSLEVSPEIADDTAATVQSARELWQAVDRPNAMIKIPGTSAGLAAITETLGQGISVNVTLIFGLDQYRRVTEAFLAGLEQAAAAGHDLSTITSVASFFVSRLDTAIDPLLDASAHPHAADLRGRTGVANARLAYGVFLESLESSRWQALTAQGAHPQRPLWASTGVKDARYPATLYVQELIAAPTVNTMPEATLQAFAQDGEPTTDTITPQLADAEQVMAQLADVGIDYAAIVRQLEEEGVAKFRDAFAELTESVRRGLEQAR